MIERFLALPVPRLVVGVLWLLLLAVGAWHIHTRPASKPSEKPVPLAKAGSCPSASSLQGRPHYSAIREMAVNHRLGESDVNWGDSAGKDLNKTNFIARYLACPAHVGDPIVLDVLGDAPAVQPSAGKMIYLLTVAQVGKTASSLDVGTALDVFEGNRPLLRKVSVLAVQCSDAATADCSVLLDLTPSEGDLLLHADLDKLQIVRLHP